MATASAAAYAAFALDKQAAIEGRRRIPEARLLALAAVGGSPGALLAQRTLRHKTRKQPFAALLWLIVGAQAALAAWVLVVR